MLTWTPVSHPLCSTKQLSYSIAIVQLPRGYSPLRLSTTQSKTGISDVHFNMTYMVIVRTEIVSDQLSSETAATLFFNSGNKSLYYTILLIIVIELSCLLSLIQLEIMNDTQVTSNSMSPVLAPNCSNDNSLCKFVL